VSRVYFCVPKATPNNINNQINKSHLSTLWIPQTKDKNKKKNKRAINTRRYGYKPFSPGFWVGFSKYA
jgi:hypothetical protein